MPRIAEGNIKVLKEVLASDEVEAYPEAWREADGSLKLKRSDLDGQAVHIDRDLASVTHCHHGLDRSAAQRETQALGVGLAKDTETCSGVDIAPHLTPSKGSLDLNGYKRGREFSVKEAVLEGYRAQLKSSGLGMGRPVGVVSGCLRRASLSRRAASVPTKSSPSATTAYFPGYLSTSLLKWRRTHSRSSVRRDDFATDFLSLMVSFIASLSRIPLQRRFGHQPYGFH